MLVRVYQKDGNKIEYDHVKNLREDMRSAFIDGKEYKRFLYIEFIGSYETHPIESIDRVAVRFRSDEFQEGE